MAMAKPWDLVVVDTAGGSRDEQRTYAEGSDFVVAPCQPAAVNAGAPETMHENTLAALRLLVLALQTHPEDLAVLQVYGDMGEHLVDLIADYIDSD